MKKEEIVLTFETTETTLNPTDLADFLYLFRAVYNASIRYLKLDKHNIEREDIAVSSEFIKEVLHKIGYANVNKLFNYDFKDFNLKTSKISKSSPLEIAFVGLFSASVITAMIAGGEVDFLRLRVKMNSLADVLIKFKEALAIKRTDETGFAVKNKTITLNQVEFDELMKQKESSKGKGGFQNYIVKLQYRINKNTRVLQLTDLDIDKLRKWGSKPKKGGWQARIKRIFGRHLSF